MSNPGGSWLYAKDLQRLRAERGFSAQDIEDATSGQVTRHMIANLESGRKRDLGVGELIALAEALGVEPYQIDPRVSPSAAEMTARLEHANNIIATAFQNASWHLSPTSEIKENK